MLQPALDRPLVDDDLLQAFEKRLREHVVEDVDFQHSCVRFECEVRRRGSVPGNERGKPSGVFRRRVAAPGDVHVGAQQQQVVSVNVARAPGRRRVSVSNGAPSRAHRALRGRQCPRPSRQAAAACSRPRSDPGSGVPSADPYVRQPRARPRGRNVFPKEMLRATGLLPDDR